MTAIWRTAQMDTDVLKNLMMHIGMGIGKEMEEDDYLAMEIRIAEIDAEFKQMLAAIAAETPIEEFDQARVSELMNEKHNLQERLAHRNGTEQERQITRSRLDEICDILDGLRNHPLTFDDQIVRQILECVVVLSEDRIKVVFVGGMEVEQEVR